jgi:NAD(P)-dependent dehydrogenase (short-subunit alcohol dehydrogenase family)
MRFEGRVAIITGGTGALGQAITRRLLADGAVACVPYAVAAEADVLRGAVADADRPRLHAAPSDVADPSAFGAFVADALGRHRRIDVLVNAVGGFAGGTVASTTPELWQQMLTLNLTTTYVACHAVLPAMLEAARGRIINIGSRAVVPPAGGFTAYTVAKTGVLALTQALAQEVRSRGITVNAVLPSTMDTPANRAAMPDADRSGWVSVDSVAEVVAFLASDSAREVTGGLIPV